MGYSSAVTIRRENKQSLPLYASVTAMAIAISLNTAITIHPDINNYFDAAVSTNRNTAVPPEETDQQESLTSFALELQRRSISISEEDSKLLREIVSREQQPGFPVF